MIFLLYQRIINFFIISINFAESLDSISFILSLNRFNFTVIHVVENSNLIFHKIDLEFGYLLVGRFFIILFKFLSNFQNHHLSNVMINIVVVFACRQLLNLLFVFCESATSIYYTIISILIFLNCLLSNSLYPLHQAIVISVWII